MGTCGEQMRFGDTTTSCGRGTIPSKNRDATIVVHLSEMTYFILVDALMITVFSGKTTDTFLVFGFSFIVYVSLFGTQGTVPFHKRPTRLDCYF